LINHHDNDGGQTKTWKTIFQDEKFADFYICGADHDDLSKILIQGSNPGFCKRFSETSSAQASGNSWNNFSQHNLPLGIQNLVNKSHRGTSGNWNGWGSNRYRYYESSFDVNEKLAVLSKIVDGSDDIKIAERFLPNADFFDKANQEWDEWDIRAVKELAGKQGVVLVSDSKKLTGQVTN
jgi:hypothetical protein